MKTHLETQTLHIIINTDHKWSHHQDDEYQFNDYDDDGDESITFRSLLDLCLARLTELTKDWVCVAGF